MTTAGRNLSVFQASLQYLRLRCTFLQEKEKLNLLCAPPVQPQRYEVLRQREARKELSVRLAYQFLTHVDLRPLKSVTVWAPIPYLLAYLASSTCSSR